MTDKIEENEGKFKQVLEAKNVYNHLNGWKMLFCDMNDLVGCFR